MPFDIMVPLGGERSFYIAWRTFPAVEGQCTCYKSLGETLIHLGQLTLIYTPANWQSLRTVAT